MTAFFRKKASNAENTKKDQALGLIFKSISKIKKSDIKAAHEIIKSLSSSDQNI